MSILRKSHPTFTVIEPRNTWRIVDGQHYREVVVRVHADGLLHLFLIREDES